MPGGSIWDALGSGGGSEEEATLKFMFPAKNKFEFKQMLSDLQGGAVVPFSVLGVFRRKYKSKTLYNFQDEHNSNKTAQERKGRLEGSEIIVGMRRAAKDTED